MLDWGRSELGITINEFYGQTECNVLVSSCSDWFQPVTGMLGKVVPGHEVVVLGSDGQPAPAGVLGEIAVRSPDPVMFLGYWNAQAATAAKFRGEWLLTGDLGVLERADFIRFVQKPTANQMPAFGDQPAQALADVYAYIKSIPERTPPPVQNIPILNDVLKTIP